jgi:predicted nucleic acid-binding protein
MKLKLMLDTDILARLCHPTQFRDVQDWFRRLLELGRAAPELLVSVLADYELRRKLQDLRASESLRQLDSLARSLRYVPVTAETSRRAAELRQSLSGELGRSGLSDAALLVAAQASVEDAVLVTSDAALRRIPNVSAKDWREIDPAPTSP